MLILPPRRTRFPLTLPGESGKEKDENWKFKPCWP
jgi:hypothetical protein